VPARVPEPVAARAVEAAGRLAQALGYVGVLCVEFFLLADGSLVVNEMAPRPHNSGHWSIDACVSSQFEQQARVLAGWPAGGTRQLAPAVMLNLLGDLWFAQPGAPAREPDWARVLALPEAKLHLYGKHEPRPGRKMGHITVMADTAEAAWSLALRLERELGPGAGAAGH
jgi:5-(carboxyamino)imidazole ribonucleotide synthase